MLFKDDQDETTDCGTAGSDIRRCARCVLPESLPSVTLGQDDVCSHCVRHAGLPAITEQTREQAEQRFAAIVERARRKKRRYDCLVPLSGGKDSTWTLYVCAKRYGLKCLCVTLDNGYMSDCAKSNIEKAIELSGADHIFYRVNRSLLLRLYRLFLQKCGNFCPVCMRGIQLCIETAQKAFRIPLVVTGGGARITYMDMHPEVFEAGDAAFFRNVVKGESIEREARALAGSPFPWKRVISKLCRAARIPSPVTCIEIHDYILASHAEMKRALHDEMGWRVPGAQFEHTDCLLHDIPTYIHALKFPELTSKTFYHSSLVRLGEMTRDEALAIEESESHNNKTPDILQSFLRDIGIDDTQFTTWAADWHSISNYRNALRSRLISVYRRMGS